MNHSGRTVPSVEILNESRIRAAFAALAAVEIALAIWMIVSPHSFYTSIGAFEAYNPHYERDAATFQLAFGFGAAVAVVRPAWRIPVLAVITFQFAAHAINHIGDIGRANNSWAGPFDAITLALTAVQFGVLLWLLTQRGKDAR